jgi:hypothetical protein
MRLKTGIVAMMLLAGLIRPREAVGGEKTRALALEDYYQLVSVESPAIGDGGVAKGCAVVPPPRNPITSEERLLQQPANGQAAQERKIGNHCWSRAIFLLTGCWRQTLIEAVLLIKRHSATS